MITAEKIMSVKKGKVAVKIIVACLLTFLAGMGVIHFLKNMAYVTTDDAYVEGRIHQIAPKIPGTVSKVYVVDNQKVKKGDLLVDIDPQDYEVKVKEAEAVYSAESARLKEADARISGAEAALEVQETTLRQAKIDAGRAERLFAEGAYPKEKLEKAQTAYDFSKAQIKAAKEMILQARANKELEASLVKQRQAALEKEKLNLGYTKIFAPADGFVTRKSVEDGNQLQPGQPLMAVVALDDVWVAANFKETQLKGIKPGQEAFVEVDTYPGHVFKGKVDSVMAGTGSAFTLFPTENALGNYVKVVQRIPVKIILDNDSDSGHVFRVGMSVIAKIRVKNE
ncbi:MAG: HlyD family secretion protein [Candidatus Omnitrophica bacterium]|nr:HlyD family secretion protein [Candidatus Omnitrophota bacterium]